MLQYLSDKVHDIIVLAVEDKYSCRIPWELYPVRMVSSSTNPVSACIIIRDLKYLFKVTRPDIMLLYNFKPNVYDNFSVCGLGIPTISILTELGFMYTQKAVNVYFKSFNLILSKSLAQC